MPLIPPRSSTGAWLGCILVIVTVFPPSHAWSQATDSGVIEKSLRQSRPEFKPPAAQEISEIVVEDSRTLEDAGAGPAF